MNNARFHNTTDDRSYEWDGEGVINVELEGSVGIIMSVVRKDVKESPYEVKRLSCHIGDLEDGANTLADELCLEGVCQSGLRQG